MSLKINHDEDPRIIITKTGDPDTFKMHLDFSNFDDPAYNGSAQMVIIFHRDNLRKLKLTIEEVIK